MVVHVVRVLNVAGVVMGDDDDVQAAKAGL